ncbi:MAG: hypothetical protein IR164_00105 [Devosia sp.]|uniref:hypothetical protein n=1 Tax=Devosia sp. TaxID=1871048 RepID=UPI001A0A2535|nr:hypothetical protein [Devosia sp.]MBF0677320.1 hypothetical protein [Devosia sp.]
MAQVLAAAMTATLTGLGWIISRWLKRDALTERVDRRLKLIALHQRMREAGLTLNDLERLEERLNDFPPGVVPAVKVGSTSAAETFRETEHSKAIDARSKTLVSGAQLWCF